MVAVAGEHFVEVPGRLGIMGDEEPRHSQGRKTVLFTPKTDNRRHQNLRLE